MMISHTADSAAGPATQRWPSSDDDTRGASRAPAGQGARQRIAVVGAGIAGLASAWLLGRDHDVTLFEQADYAGGHTNTVDVTLQGVTYPVDTGFLVHNDVTYPNLIALFAHLGVKTHESDMSFSVSVDAPDMEWAGTNLGTVFAQRRNLLRPAFLGMLRDIMRFNRHARQYVDEVNEETSLGSLLDTHRYGQAMRHWYLLPMAAAIWSTSVKDMLAFPARTFLVFCLNHHLLQVEGRPKWKTVLGGARSYVQAMLPDIADLRLSQAVTHVRRDPLGLSVSVAGRADERFDAVVMACHAPQTLSILDATPREAALLGEFRYQPNRAILHTDISLLPRRRKTWSAWNYLSSAQADATRPVAVSYSINRLQPVPFDDEVIVTLNPFRQPAPEHVLAQFDYEHPILDARAVRAQKRLHEVQGQNRVWFCGAWTRYGFHEDGLLSALTVARDFGVRPPWEVT